MMPNQSTPNEEPRAPTPFPRLDLRAVLAAPRPELDFVLPGLPAATVGALVAPGATGKTTLALQLCASVAVGGPALGGLFPPSTAGRAVLVTAEDPVPILANRMQDLLAWLLAQRAGRGDSVLEVARHADIVARLEAGLTVAVVRGRDAMLVARGQPQSAAIDALVALAAGARLLVIDPLRRFHDGDENDSAAATALVQTVELVARRTGAAVLLSHHTSKGASLGGAGSEQQAARGSSALTDGVRWQGNLRVMSEAEAESLGIAADHRRQYVRFDIPKANYAAPFPGAWLRRGPGGMQTLCEPRAEPVRHGRQGRKERGCA